MNKIISLRHLLLSVGIAATGAQTVAHESQFEGHIPANVNYGFEVVGRDSLGGVEDGLYTDVWSHNGYAYVGTFHDPGCTNAGVFVVDINQAISQYQAEGAMTGATVAEIKSAPHTRVNDVKVHSVGDVDVLIATEEPCGGGIPGGATSDANITKPCPLTAPDCNRNNDQGNKNPPGEQGPGADRQHGRGGISLYDVTDPTQPKPLIKSYLDFRGVHNTYPWDWEGRSYLIGTADTFDFFDTFIVDITDPRKPQLLKITGAWDWIPYINFDQLETGSSAGIFNHDVWVNIIDGTPTAVISYWDLGFVTLDVTDPANPVFLRDTTYPLINASGQPYEGNAHAAVFGGNGDYIFGGDEDFSPASFALLFQGVDYPAAGALFGPDPNTLDGDIIWSGGTGCTADAIPPATGDNMIALIQRGECDFSAKGYNAEVQGYVGFVIANDAARGDTLVGMSLGALPEPSIPGIFVGYSTGEIIKDAGGGAVAASSVYDGWGYLHVINNTEFSLSVPEQGRDNPAEMLVTPGEHLGYYAPAETVDSPELGTDFGDLTMHNLEADPLTQDVEPSFFDGPRMFVSWYSLGMRALEYRPGHYHANLRGEGFFSQNVHEVGRWIDPEGSNFWGIHLDSAMIDGEETQIILASDRNLGLYVFTFSCQTTLETGETIFYCVIPGSEPPDGGE